MKFNKCKFRYKIKTKQVKVKYCIPQIFLILKKQNIIFKINNSRKVLNLTISKIT